RSPAERERYDEDYGDMGEVAGSGASVVGGSCLDLAQQATGTMPINEAALSVVANLYQYAMDTPERAKLDGAYAECVQTEGYDASLPQDMQMMVWGLGVDVPPEERTRLELRIASADVA